MKTIVMYEGGQEHVLTAAKLQTPLQSGGTCYWVPEDETNLVTKYVSENGTYNASGDNAYGYSSVTVNVPGGEGSADSSGYPTYIPPTETTPSSGVPSGGIGSSIIGTDPETGNEEYVGVDSTGTIVKAPIPTSIVLVTPPTKTDYNDGESIDLSGAVVVAKMADGTTWTDADHPNGHIALSELIVDPTTADASKASAWWTDPGWSVNAAGTYLGFVNDRQFYKTNDGIAAAAFQYGGWVGPILISTDRSATLYSQGETINTIEKDGLTFYVNHGFHYYGTNNFGSTLHMISSQSNGWLDPIMEHVHVNGSGEDSQTITINWARPADGKVLSTTMEINVSDHTTESSSGTGGSGGGGTF